MSHVSRLSLALRPSDHRIIGSSGDLQSLALDEFRDPMLARSEDPVFMLTPAWSEAPNLDPSLEQACRVVRDPDGHLELDLCFELEGELEQYCLPIQEGDYSRNGDGSVKRFGMCRLGPGTWLLQPSLNIPGEFHAFIVLCEVPEPPPWQSTG